MDIKHIEPKRTNESRILLPTSLDYKTCVLGGRGSEPYVQQLEESLKSPNCFLF